MKNILVVATGSVAVEKTKKTIDLLKQDFNVKTIASDYVLDNFNKIKNIDIELKETNLGTFPKHIELVKWANLIVVVPASANTMSKFVAGVADNFVLTTLLAARTPIIFVPAMNTFMYQAIKQRGIIDKIWNLNHLIIGPVYGKLKEGETGLGRMTEPEDICKAIKNYFGGNKKNIVITYGASKVYIDPVRYITNNSTGTMGKLLINKLRLQGHKVIGINIFLMNNHEIIDKLRKIDFDIYMSPAAFADFDVIKNNTKIKKGEIDKIILKDNIDVLTSIKLEKPDKKYLGFKLDEDINNAIIKLKKLSLDGILWNKINSFGKTKISGALITDNNQIPFEDISKDKIADLIIKEFV